MKIEESSCISTLEELSRLISDFKTTFVEAQPTPAHVALTKICLNKPAHIITGNGDLLHEKTGIKAWFVMSGRFDDVYGKPLPVQGNFAYLNANLDWLKEIDYLVCIGMGRDINDVVAMYKQKNQYGKVISIDLKQPQFIMRDDYFLQGDIQHILPALAKYF